MDEKVVQLTESSFGKKLIPDTPVYPIVLDRSVLMMDKKDNKYVPLNSLDLIGFMELSEYFSKFVPFNQYVTSILQTSGAYEGVVKGEVIYCTSKNIMLLKIEHDAVLGDVTKYYTEWTGEQSILGYPSSEYNNNGAIRTSRFFYTVDTGLTFYKYSEDLHLLVPTATGSESVEPGYIEQVIDNIFNSYINTAAHIKPISYWIDSDMELPEFISVEEGSYAYWEGHGLYVRWEELMDWDLVATDTIGQFFYYNNTLYEWDGTNLIPVIDTAAVTTALHNEFNTIIENENEYIKTLTTWHHLYAYVPNDDEDIMPMLDGGEDLYIYRQGVMYHSEDEEWVVKNSSGDDNIDNHFFYNLQYLFQYRNNTLFVIFNFETMIRNILPIHLENALSDKTKTINGLSLWKNDNDEDNIQIPSIEYVSNFVSSLINKGSFNKLSDNAASQKSIYSFVFDFVENNKGKVLVPKYCCAQSELPIGMMTGAVWYDTENDRLLKIISSTSFENYAAVGEPYLVFLKTTVSGVITYDVVLYVQTGTSSSIVYSLTKGSGISDSINSISFYTPVGWNDDRPGSGYPANSAFFNSATNRLYISSNVDVWGDAPAGSYLLHKSSTSEYYIFDQFSGGSAGVLTPLTVPDAALSTTSKNTVQNKIVTQFINELQDWKGRIILPDGTGTQIPNYFNYWFDDVNQMLLKGTPQGAQVIHEGVYIIITPKRDKIGVFNADTGASVQLATTSHTNDLWTELNKKAATAYVDEGIVNATGKIIPVKLFDTIEAYRVFTGWEKGDYFFQSNAANGGKLFIIGDNGQIAKEIGAAGESYIFVSYKGGTMRYYLWNVGSAPVSILTSNDRDSLVAKNTFEMWRNKPVPVDYWNAETPQSPSNKQIWYNPVAKTLQSYDGTNDDWVDVIQNFAASDTYLLLDKSSGNLYIVPNNSSPFIYPSDALQDVYLNGALVSSRNIDGRQAVELNVDSSLFDLTVNKGEVISPVWGELDENETYLEGDYWLDTSSTPNELKKYIVPEGETELDWVEITSGSYILRNVDASGEHLYSFTVGEEPTQLATYAEITDLTGGITGIKKSNNSTIQPDANGVITLPPYIEMSALGSYITRTEFNNTVNGALSNFSQNLALVQKHGKAVAISKVVDISLITVARGTTYNSYLNSNTYNIVMASNGELLLEVISSGTYTYYASWGRYTSSQREIIASSDCRTWDLYFLNGGTDYIFWTWDGSKYVPSPNLGNLALKADKSEVDLLAKIIKIEGLYDENPEDTRMTGVSDHYYVLGCYQQNPQPVLCKYTNSSMQPVHVSGLYVLCDLREHKLYIYEEITGDSDNYLVGIPTNIDYRILQQAIPDWVKIVRHFGSTSMNGNGISYSPGDLWYDSSNHLLKYFTTTYEFDEQQSATSPLLIYNNNETNDDAYPAGLYLYIRGQDVYPTGNTSGAPATAGSGAILIKYWQSGTPSGASNGEYWYDTNATENKLAVRSEGTWRADLIEQDALYVSPKPSEIVDQTQKAYGNTIFRWDGSDLVALSNDDELTSVLTDLATQLQQQAASLSNIVATAGSDFPTSAVIGQCYFKTGANNTGQPWWYAGNNVWVDATGTPYDD